MIDIAIFGSAKNFSELDKKSATQLGVTIAKSGCRILTGACPGLPYYAAKAAYQEEGYIIGYSPARTFEDHTEYFGDPFDVFTELIFLDKEYEFYPHKQASYKYRNIRTAMACNAAIIIGGGMGTLNEFILSYEFNKPIGVLLSSGGVADELQSFLQKLSPPRKMDKILFERNSSTLIQNLIRIVGS